MKSALAALSVSWILSGILHAQEPSAEALNEISALVKIAPDKRTKEQKERIREIWRSGEEVQKALRGAAVLQDGDSVFDFPGLICGKTIKFDAVKREYTMSDSYSAPSGDGGKDRWDVRIIFSEDGTVTHTGQLKINSR
jgi:hypothetical protein